MAAASSNGTQRLSRPSVSGDSLRMRTRKYCTRTRSTGVSKLIGRPTFPTSSPTTPASSSTSRRAACAGVSPASIWPFGKIQALGFRFAVTRRISKADPFFRYTMPPAWVTRRL
jgi:hypothetical protein